MSDEEFNDLRKQRKKLDPSKFILSDKLGEGGYGSVSVCDIGAESCFQYAIKKVRKNVKESLRKVEKEIDILRYLKKDGKCSEIILCYIGSGHYDENYFYILTDYDVGYKQLDELKKLFCFYEKNVNNDRINHLQPLKINDDITCNYNNEGKYLPGKICRINDGNYDIVFEDSIDYYFPPVLTMEPERMKKLSILLKIFADIRDAITYIHSRFVAHRDIKPANILVHFIYTMENCEIHYDNSTFKIKLIDFGESCKSEFNVETKVIGNYRNEGKFYPGKIEKVNDDNTYGILYDDSDRESGVPINRIRNKDFLSYGEGTVIIGNYKNKGTFHPGKIEKVNADKTYDILYDDGDEENGVAINRIQNPDIPCDYNNWHGTAYYMDIRDSYDALQIAPRDNKKSFEHLIENDLWAFGTTMYEFFVGKRMLISAVAPVLDIQVKTIANYMIISSIVYGCLFELHTFDEFNSNYTGNKVITQDKILKIHENIEKIKLNFEHIDSLFSMFGKKESINKLFEPHDYQIGAELKTENSTIFDAMPIERMSPTTVAHVDSPRGSNMYVDSPPHSPRGPNPYAKSTNAKSGGKKSKKMKGKQRMKKTRKTRK
jgi:serine/threonine protein kinase